MRLVLPFLRLIRWPNLFFIGLTQWLYWFVLARPVALAHSASIDWDLLFYSILIASVFIAAGGYVINDYFDRQIDEHNKPGKVVLDRFVKRRWGIAWHLLLSLAGLLASGFVSYRLRSPLFLLANTGSVLLLWFYSTHFKKWLLTGNLLIAALTAWVILVIYGLALTPLDLRDDWFSAIDAGKDRFLFKVTMLYAGFAFIVSLIREVVKDAEDRFGDARFDCRTMPIVWGIPATKVFIAVWIIVCAGALTLIQFYAWKSGWRFGPVFISLFVIAPLLYLLRATRLASDSADFHRISRWLKGIMLAGILSLLFFHTTP